MALLANPGAGRCLCWRYARATAMPSASVYRRCGRGHVGVRRVAGWWRRAGPARWRWVLPATRACSDRERASLR
ncbi:hypothetical protein PHYSODRAFT_356020 [Phytophthora sojae]|uniref:Uncharacterized protein n=1 Tax=Phytophthora sojae (strain P6497) TaxID=1094619 RepID=G5A9U7_PHYSP|nr:hypothetical protein PHYSODRAFT_356020 [Phytophthora sojae]EGZ07377.1 hypothetical protein PHYSODRAFT_356020 [Phytophthora sojae]|eukprot:XP_009536943.1 hypothetical protein PHYSODRAFT_356020 [Phytophthora sojae]